MASSTAFHVASQGDLSSVTQKTDARLVGLISDFYKEHVMPMALATATRPSWGPMQLHLKHTQMYSLGTFFSVCFIPMIACVENTLY